MVIRSKESSMASFGASAAGSRTTPPTPSDPYRYQLGFGNYFSSEAVYAHLRENAGEEGYLADEEMG